MKKVILSAMAICSFAFTTNAQILDNITFGAKAGLNLANVSGDVKYNDMKAGFHIGAVAEMMINDKFAVQGELLYSTQGFKTESTDSGIGWSEKEESNTKLNYLAIPIMAKYYVTDKISLLAGPQISFLTGAEIENTYTIVDVDPNDPFDYSIQSRSENLDIKEFTNSIDFGLNFGAEYKMENGLNFSLRYNLGLSNIIDVSGLPDEINNRVLQFSVGYFFN